MANSDAFQKWMDWYISSGQALADVDEVMDYDEEFLDLAEDVDDVMDQEYDRAIEDVTRDRDYGIEL
jgi:hypothetical protein